MLLLRTRPACKAAINEEQENISRRRVKFSCFFCLELVKEVVGYERVKQTGRSTLYEH